MQIVTNIIDPRVIETLCSDELIIARTDTIYGILARAHSEKAIQKLYKIKQRDAMKACIILVATPSSIPGISSADISRYAQLAAEKPTSIILPASEYFPHVPHHNDTLAFRMVPESPLAELIHQVGPLVAPSANPQGQPPAATISEAIAYFGEKIPVYVDGGAIKNSSPSRIVRLSGDELVIVRE